MADFVGDDVGLGEFAGGGKRDLRSLKKLRSM